MSEVRLLLGDCLEQMKLLDDNSVDSIVTDPPYGFSFMGKKWDYDVPSKEIWIEALRVLKPGGHLLSFGGTRTYHRLVVNIEAAGFEIRDCIQWLYGSGFPKSHNIKEGEFKGWGTALKPANEPICVARKPLEKGLTVAENVLKYGTGAINIGVTRIGTTDEELKELNRPNKRPGDGASGFMISTSREFTPAQGRWPANIILDEEAAQALDVQTSDNVSRFFYVAKASKRERGEGNVHPTVKPIKLMEYLIKLVTPQNGTVLDPFMGSGSTGVAAKGLNYNFIGCEMNGEYLQIATKRIESNKSEENI